ncbi:ornithine cyclodeaminase family protein [Pseudomonas koreensis]|uniref:Ornithine cyclodeaminase n=1 Tax=Pseudomonas koreensis TaxID=198620 RepID=A0A9X3BCC3_9PSED|nr:ornithine cyclodeaminase [Pseudomonas koreensis]MCU7247968.1 ornithine cyclodeaminase [Pseudomonas koreensis]
MRLIPAQHIEAVLNWEGVLNALQEAHMGARPLGESYFIGDAAYGLFSRGVVLPGRGAGMKMASICPGNSRLDPPLPSEDAAFLVVDENTKKIAAVLDGPTITRFKTAADSALAARYLSREDSQVLLVLGSGPVARALTEAFLHIRPSISQVLLWNRTPEKLIETRDALVQRHLEVSIVRDLDAAVAQADIISSATGSTEPLIHGRHVRPGTHVDLVGGFRPDMQEADCELLGKARIFVDDRACASASGDILIPLQNAVITEAQIEGDLFDLCQLPHFQRGRNEITVYKNAGGAHLDMIVSQYVLSQL